MNKLFGITLCSLALLATPPTWASGHGGGGGRSGGGRGGSSRGGYSRGNSSRSSYSRGTAGYRGSSGAFTRSVGPALSEQHSAPDLSRGLEAQGSFNRSFVAAGGQRAASTFPSYNAATGVVAGNVRTSGGAVGPTASLVGARGTSGNRNGLDGVGYGRSGGWGAGYGYGLGFFGLGLGFYGGYSDGWDYPGASISMAEISSPPPLPPPPPPDEPAQPGTAATAADMINAQMPDPQGEVGYNAEQPVQMIPMGDRVVVQVSGKARTEEPGSVLIVTPDQRSFLVHFDPNQTQLFANEPMVTVWLLPDANGGYQLYQLRWTQNPPATDPDNAPPMQPASNPDKDD
jgi:hypothetical protein